MTVKPGDVISVREKGEEAGPHRRVAVARRAVGHAVVGRSRPKKMEGKFKNLPEREEVARDVNESLVVELYSR